MSTASSIPAAADSAREDSPLGVSIRFRVNAGPVGPKGPWVDRALVGVLPTVGQTIEDASGQPIRVDTDLFGQQRAGVDCRAAGRPQARRECARLVERIQGLFREE